LHLQPAGDPGRAWGALSLLRDPPLADPRGPGDELQLGDGRQQRESAEAVAAKGGDAMTTSDILVIAAGAALIALIAWFFWGPKGGGRRAAVAASGYQEQLILVKGGYTPDVIVVEHGKPVRLNFRRDESASCSEMVLLPAFGKSAR